MTPPSVPALILAVALLLGACGEPAAGPGDGAPPATTAASTPATAPPALPPPTGPVTGVGTVIQTPDGTPQLCLGPVAESLPPQCEGVPLTGWDWAEHPPEQAAPTDGPATRWGSYAVTGAFDGITMSVTSAVPLALYDTMARSAPRPVAPPDLTPAQWARVESGVRLLPGLLTSAREGDTGPVYVEVVYDDGTLQDWVDTTFGTGAVRLTSMLG